MIPGRVFARRYDIETCLRSDGARRVFRARDRLLDRQVLIKGVLEHPAADVRAIQNEWRWLHRLRHPALVPPLELAVASCLPDAPSDRPFHYFTQTWIDGPSLRQQCGRGSLAEVRRWLIEGLELLAWLHHHGLTRLDLKSDHFLWDGVRWRLVDLDQVQPEDPFREGEPHGTLCYLAPEVLGGNPGGLSSDLYSIGILIYELITGSPPALEGRTRRDLLDYILARATPSLPSSVTREAPDVADACARLLIPDPAARPASAEAVLEMLEGVESGSWRRVPPSPQWVGQEELLAELEARLARADAAHGGGLMLCGPRRAGRTALLEAFAARLQQAGRPVLLVKRESVERPSPGAISRMTAWLRLFSEQAMEADEPAQEPHPPAPPPVAGRGENASLSLLPGMGRRVAEGSGSEGDDRGELAPLRDSRGSAARWSLPVGGAGPGAPAALEAEATLKERLELLIPRGLAELLELAAHQLQHGGTPVTILMDDPGALDDLTRTVLRRAAALLQGSGLWLALAGQGCEPDAGEFPGLEVIGIPPLTPLEVRELAEHTLGAGAVTTSTELDALCHWTGRLPGRVRDALVRRWWDATVDLAEPPQEGITTAGLELPGLAPGLLEAARCAAILSYDFDDELLEAVLDDDAAPGVAIQLVRAGVLESGAPGTGVASTFRFVDDLLRRGLLLGQLEAMRRCRHLRAAELHEQRAALGAGSASRERIVSHFLASDQPRRALPHLAGAVEEALEAPRLLDAVTLLNQWLELVRPNDAGRAELLRRRGWLEIELGRLEAARESFQQALQQPGLRDLALRARCLAGLGRALFKLGQYDLALEPLEAALQQRTALNPEERVRCLHWLAWIYGSTGQDLPRARELLAEARSALLPGGSRLEVDQLHVELTLAIKDGADAGQLAARTEAGLELARALRYVDGEVRLLNWLLLLYGRIGSTDRQIDAGRALIDRARASFNLEEEARVSKNLGMVLRDQGNFLAAHEHFVRAADLAARLRRPELELGYRHEVVDVLLRAGKLDSARVALRRTGQLLERGATDDRVAVLGQRLLEARLELNQVLREEKPEPGGTGPAWNQVMSDPAPVASDVGRTLPAGAEVSDSSRAWEELDRRLAELIDALEGIEPRYLQLEAVADRMTLALFRGDFQPALRLAAPFMEWQRPWESGLAWHRMHTLAARAHLALAGPAATLIHATPVTRLEPAASPTVPAARAEATPTDVPAPASERRGSDPPEGAISPAPEASSPGGSTGSTAEARPQGTPATPPGADASAQRMVTLLSPGGAAARATTGPRLEAPDQWLERVTRILEVADGEEQLAARLAELAGALLGGRGLVLFFGDRDEVIELAELRDNPVSSTLVQHVRATGAPYRSPDVHFDALLARRHSIRHMARPSVICHPIYGTGQTLLGVVYVDELEKGGSEHPAALRVVEHVAGMAGALLDAFARRRRLEREQEAAASRFGWGPAMRRVLRQIDLLARSKAPDLSVLLLGETGVGKTEFAKEIHRRSCRKDRPFIELNCATITESVFESKMFGHKKGAFTGAFADHIGVFEQAGEGTLCLDEIGDMSLDNQKKLLQVLGSRTFSRLGEEKVPLSFRAWTICATNRDLDALADQGVFRSDVLSRINANVCRIPPLRERGPDDLRLLLCAQLRSVLVESSAKAEAAPLPRFEDHFTPKAQQYLLQHPWPGNVREVVQLFKNELIRERVEARKKIDDRLISDILVSGLALPMVPGPRDARQAADPPVRFEPGLTFQQLKDRCDVMMGEYVREVVAKCGGDKNRAAGELECARDTIFKYLKRAP